MYSLAEVYPQPLTCDLREETGQGGLADGQQDPGAGCVAMAVRIFYGKFRTIR